jgi:hypothetical protein
MVRPTLLLLSSRIDGKPESRARTLAAVAELIHLATLVHDDAVDHSVLRRGMPTINALFSHQVSVIMGDFLYSRAVVELVRLGSLDTLNVLARVTNEMTIGEMRQLLAHDPLEFSEEQYDLLIKAKTASLISGACEVGGLAAPPEHRAALARFGEKLGMAFEVDGAGRLRRIWNITLPCIKGTIIILFILNIGRISMISFDRPFILGNASVKDFSDVISTYVYRVGLQSFRYNLATAVGLFQSLVGLVFLTVTNYIANKSGEEGIW